MPFPNFHAARVKDPDEFSRIRTLATLPTGIMILGGPLKSDPSGDTTAQSYRFPKDKFSVEQAKKWLSGHEVKPILFEKAEKKDGADMDIQHVMRYDRGNIKGVTVTPEGYIRGDARITRTGVFLYKNPDGSIRRELRHPDEVFKQDALDSIKMIPITNGHPLEGRVDATNIKRLKIGNTGEDVRKDGKFVVSSLVIDEEAGVMSVHNGRTGFSLGYDVDLVPESGVYKGERYDCRQTNIKHNHLSLVDSPRAGDNVRLRADESEIVDEDNIDNNNNHSPKKGGSMPTLNLDSISYECPQEVINSHNKLTTANLDLTERLDTADRDHKTELDKITAERDELKTKNDELDKEAKDTEKFNSAVRSRIDLENSASRILKADDMKEISKKTDKEIKVDCIVAKHKDFKADEKSDDYISARFDSVIEDLGPADKKEISKQKSVLVKDGDDVNLDDAESEIDSEDNRDKMIESMHNDSRGIEAPKKEKE